MNDIIKFENIEDRVLAIRGQKVLLDSDVAEIYGVETKRINEAVKNNPDKFPDGYIIELDKKEWEELKSKFSTSNKGGKVKLPTAFPEKGLYMLATILKSPRAVQATLAIIETFTKIRELSRTIKELSVINNDKKQKDLMQKSGEIIAEILEDDFVTTDTETSIEMNFAILKFKHTIKRKKPDKSK
ncbi:conserved hypothetical protein [sediment metagenome]|uniref:KilA-N DNA-binding domain-containing protein n=1 Tax=sediment metagenome TaxID=749907 RepID=D9PHY8_9ZZZZ